MAEFCICCGSKIGFLGGKELSDKYNKPICDKCYAKFGVKLNIFRNSEDVKKLNAHKEDLLKTVDECAFNIEGKRYILSYIDFKKNEIEDSWAYAEKQQIDEAKLRDEEILKKLQFKKNIDTHLITTGFNFENYKIEAYLGVLSGSSVLGTGFLSEFGASISDLFGTQSDMFSDKLEQARENSLSRLIEQSVSLGGNAIIGIDFDYITFSNNMIGVVANGTSVIIEKIEEG